jgi:hypothetical protein
VSEIENIPIISLWQPWCFWVDMEWKTIETRLHNKFKSLEGKTIGIHSAQKWDKNWEKLAGQYLTANQWQFTKDWERHKELLKVGQLLCTVFVKEHRFLTLDDSAKALIDCKDTLRVGLILGDRNRVDNIYVKGKQGIFYSPEFDKIIGSIHDRECK